MGSNIIFREYAYFVMSIVVLVIVTIKLIVKRRLLTRLVFESEEVKKRINYIVTPLVYAGLFFLIYCDFPLLQDIPNVMNKNYCVEKAIARSYDHSDSEFYRRRYADMEINGEIERMTVYSFGIEQDKEYLIVYLPHSKVGQVVVDE